MNTLRSLCLCSLLAGVAVAPAATSATTGSAPAAAARPALQRVDAASGDGGRLILSFLCQTPPASYRVGRGAGAGEVLVLALRGYRSEVPPDIALPVGLPALRVSEDSDGVEIQIPIPGVELEEVRQEGAALVISLRSRAGGAARPAPGGGEPAPAGNPDEGYRVGAGDLLSISVFGHEDLGKSVRVSPNGTINFPLLGDVLVAGMTPAEIARRLTDQLGKDYVVNPQVLVGVSEYQSQPVNVIGEVHKPGKYFLRGPTRLIDILSEAEGMSENAGSEIIITRYERGAAGGGASRQIRVSTDTLFAANNESVNIPLSAGDMVRVQAAPFFYIRGEVGRPGQYPVRTETTIQKAISLAGGFTLWADQKGVQVIRQQGGQSKKVVLNMRKIARGEAPDLKIEPEDVIVVTRRIL